MRGEMVARAGKKEEGRSAASQVGGLEKRGEEIGGGGPAVGVPRGAGTTWGLAPRRKRGGRAQMNSTVLDLFKLIQMSSN
jgi:hypothetical protein